jgi:hypothetical protein
VADPAFAPSATHGVGPIVAIAGATVVIAGIAQIVLGAIGAANSARFVPFPFVAGFMCGASALIVVAQLTPITGVTRGDLAAGADATWDALQLVTLGVGIATAATIWAVGWRSKRVPAAIVGLLAGSVLYYAIAFLVPHARSEPSSARSRRDCPAHGARTVGRSAVGGDLAASALIPTRRASSRSSVRSTGCSRPSRSTMRPTVGTRPSARSSPMASPTS